MFVAVTSSSGSFFWFFNWTDLGNTIVPWDELDIDFVGTARHDSIGAHFPLLVLLDMEFIVLGERKHTTKINFND